MSALNEEVKELKRRNVELAKALEDSKLTTAQIDREKLNLIRERNELKLKLNVSLYLYPFTMKYRRKTGCKMSEYITENSQWRCCSNTSIGCCTSSCDSGDTYTFGASV